MVRRSLDPCIYLAPVLKRTLSRFSYVFTYSGNNSSLRAFLNAIVLVVETPQVIATFVTVSLNLILKESEADIAEERRKVLLSYGIEEGVQRIEQGVERK